jgi:hypothetical protein
VEVEETTKKVHKQRQFSHHCVTMFVLSPLPPDRPRLFFVSVLAADFQTLKKINDHTTQVCSAGTNQTRIYYVRTVIITDIQTLCQLSWEHQRDVKHEAMRPAFL